MLILTIFGVSGVSMMDAFFILQRDNMLLNSNVLENSYRHNVEKVVSVLTTSIFPDQITYPADESMVRKIISFVI